jgi:hypothetical protein
MKKYVVSRQIVINKGHGIQGVTLTDDYKEFKTYEELNEFWESLETVSYHDMDFHKEYYSYLAQLEINGELVGELYQSLTEVE